MNTQTYDPQPTLQRIAFLQHTLCDEFSRIKETIVESEREGLGNAQDLADMRNRQRLINEELDRLSQLYRDVKSL